MDLLIFIIALSVLVLVHELGHFYAAKITGVKVEEFGLGLPPKIVSKKIGETVYSLNWLPIGGFCKLYGEDGDGNGKNAFNHKNPWQKLLIIIGGVLMNLILAVLIFCVVYTVMGVPKLTKKVVVDAVLKDSPAYKSGLVVGDWVYKVGGVVVENPGSLTNEVSKYKGKDVELTIKNDTEEKIIKVNVRDNPPAGEGSMGVAISNVKMEKVPWYRFYEGIGAGFQEAYYWGKIIFDGVSKMFVGLFMGQIPKDVSGPIGMYQATSSIKQNQGLLVLLHFFGIISVNLAVVNILPFPALDGGRLIFVLYEMVFRKKPNQRFEIAVNNLGMLFLLSLILLVTVSDIMRLIVK